MPYSSVKELPPEAQSLTAKEKRAFLKAFNSALAQGKSEADAFRIAWAAAKRAGSSDKAATTRYGKGRGYGPPRDKAQEDVMESAEGIVTRPHKFSPQPDKPSLCASCNKSRGKGPHVTQDSAADSFSDTMTALRRAVRDKMGRRSYLVDASSDWVVYERYSEEADEYVMYRRSYSGSADGVTLGEDASEVMRKTVYVPVAKQDAAAGLVEIWGATLVTPMAQPTRAELAKAKSQTPHQFKAQPGNSTVCAVCNRAKGDALHTQD
jgi:cation transport regulator ChaB